MIKNLYTNNGNIANNQYIIVDGNKTIFQSYESIIVVIDNDNHSIVFGKDWKYSNTTNKYRIKFMESMGFRNLATTKEIEKAFKDGYYKEWKVDYNNEL